MPAMSGPYSARVMTRRRLWILWLIGVMATIVVYAVCLAPLESRLRAGGHGIVALELAWTPATFAAIAHDWGVGGVDAARRQVWWDFLWIPSYALALSTSLRLAARGRVVERWALVAVPLAALCDCLENAAMLLALAGIAPRLLVPLASLMASVKFTLLAVALVVLLWALLARLSKALQGRAFSGRSVGSPRG